MTRPTDGQFRAAARKLFDQPHVDPMQILSPDHHGEVQHPHGDYAMVQVWIRVEDAQAAEELP